MPPATAWSRTSAGTGEKLEPEPVAQQPVDAIDRERADVDHGHAVVRRSRDGDVDLGVVDRPPAGDHADRLIVQTPEDELEHPGRWFVQPLDVVDRQDQRAIACRTTDDVSRSDKEYGERLGRIRSRHPQQCRFERDALRLGQFRQRPLVRQIAEEVVQRREGECGLHLRRSGDDDPVAARPCRRDGLLQSVDLPMPAGPENKSTPNRCSTPSRKGATGSSSRSRPMTETLTTPESRPAACPRTEGERAGDGAMPEA